MGKRALGALAAVALSATACGYDYVDRQAALEAGASPERAAPACHAGEPVADAAVTTGKELLARPEGFAGKTLRVRGTLRARDGAERLATDGGEIALDLSQLPPWWIDTCPDKVVDVFATVGPSAAGSSGPALRAVAMDAAP